MSGLTTRMHPANFRKEKVVKYKYFKKWKDAPAKLVAEGEPVDWFEVTYEEVEKRLDGCFKDIDIIFETLHAGHDVNTPFSLFRAKEGSDRYIADSQGFPVRDPNGRLFLCMTCNGQGWDKEEYEVDCPFREAK